VSWPTSDRHDRLPSNRRPLGRRAEATRRRILEAITKLLETEGILELKVVPVARQVGTSPATFHQYVANVEEAVFLCQKRLATTCFDLCRTSTSRGRIRAR
jgi:AcrR family transcriptional regulator